MFNYMLVDVHDVFKTIPISTDTFNPEMDQTTYMAGTTTTHTATSIALTTETDTEGTIIKRQL